MDEALKQIRETWPSNGGYLDDLKDRLTGPQPMPLLPFVGAGLSVPMDFPSWGQFLENLAAECSKTDEIEALLGEGESEEAAEIAEEALSPTVFTNRVAHTFGKRKSEQCELKGPVLLLPKIAGGAVVTTNFDRILERVFQDAGVPFEHVAWGSQVRQIGKAVAENEPFLLKIHGDAEETTTASSQNPNTTGTTRRATPAACARS